MIATYTYRPDGLRHYKTINNNRVITTTHIWVMGDIVSELNTTGASSKCQTLDSHIYVCAKFVAWHSEKPKRPKLRAPRPF